MRNLDQLPLISIIVPSYNQGHFLNQALLSIFNQNYPCLEVIVMDGGSTDNSVDIIKQHASKIVYWQSQPDGGQSAAINAGMKRATGELVTWLNSDDFYLKDAFKHVLKVYQANPQASFYAGNGHRVTHTGMIKEPFFRHHNIVFDRHSLIVTVDYIMQPATFMNRALVKKVNYLDPKLHYGMDWDLYIRLSEHAEPIIYFDLIAASREYQDTKTASGYFHRIEELRGIAKSHSGYELTPGVMCYIMGDILDLCYKHPDIYPYAYLVEIHRLWEANKKVMLAHDMDNSGYIIGRKSLQEMEWGYKKIYENISLFFNGCLKNNKLFAFLKQRLHSSVKSFLSFIIVTFYRVLSRIFFLMQYFFRAIKNIIRRIVYYPRRFYAFTRTGRFVSKNVRQLYYRIIYGFYAK